jgi:hypothetical protein
MSVIDEVKEKCVNPSDLKELVLDFLDGNPAKNTIYARF